MTEFTFELTNPVDYQGGGQNLTGKTLTLRAPSYKNRRHCQKLKQLFFKAIKPMMEDAKNAAKDKQKGEQGNPTGEDILNIFLISDVDMEEVMDVFERLLLDGICQIDNFPIPKKMFDQMSLDDMEKLFGEYMSHFLSMS